MFSFEYGLLHHYLNAAGTYLDDGDGAWLQSGVEGCCASSADGGTCLDAGGGKDADRCAVVSSLNGQLATVRLNEYGSDRELYSIADVGIDGWFLVNPAKCGVSNIAVLHASLGGIHADVVGDGELHLITTT